MWSILLNKLRKIFACSLVLFLVFVIYFSLESNDSNDLEYFITKKQSILSNNSQEVIIKSKVVEKTRFGEMGRPVLLEKNNLSDEVKNHIKSSEKYYGYNRYVSDLISVDRDLPDERPEECKKFFDKDDVYPFNNDFLDVQVPLVSVIIVFHNEAWSVLLRTVHSVINRSSNQLLHEILLVDDHSTRIVLKERLRVHLKKEIFKKVRLLRTARRLGVAAARRFATRHAVSSVLIFLDSCCECTEGWIEPILNRLILSQRVIAVPVINQISPSTFEYQSSNPNTVAIDGFNWNLDHVSHKITVKNNSIDPVLTPVISVGIFGIFRNFFNFLDSNGYSIPLDVYHLEMSLNAWICNGRIEIVPCSHIGYIFRNTSVWKPDTSDLFTSRRTLKCRVAELWLDDYKNYYYERLGNGLIKIGELVELRKYEKQEWKCNSFKWYLDHVYPQMKIVESRFSGELRYLKNNSSLCLDSSTDVRFFNKLVNLSLCHGKGENQFWIFSKDEKITRDDACLAYNDDSVILSECSNNNTSQFWSYDDNDKIIHHKDSGKCLAVFVQKILHLENCSIVNKQSWTFKRYDYKIIY